MSSKEDEAQPRSKNKSKKRRKRETGFEEWGGYMAAKKSKLEAQFQGQQPLELQNEHKSSIFNGVSIFVNGYTNPSADELKRLMWLHGGVYHHYYSNSKTTHIIASNLPNSKIKNLKKEIVVTVDWIIDSIKSGKLLPTHKYLLYSPETKDKQRTICFSKLPAKTDNQTSKDVININSITEFNPAGEHSKSSTLSEFNPVCNHSTKSAINDYSDYEVVTSPPCFENSESSPENPIQLEKENSDSNTSNVNEKSSPPCFNDLKSSPENSDSMLSNVLEKSSPPCFEDLKSSNEEPTELENSDSKLSNVLDKSSPPCFDDLASSPEKLIHLDSTPEELSQPHEKNRDSNLLNEQGKSSSPCFGDIESFSKELNLFERESKDLKFPNAPKIHNVPSCSVVNVDTSPQKQELAMKAGHPEFLSEFYSHSRLHHISTGGQELKRYVQYLIENKKDFSGREKLKELAEKLALPNDFKPLQDSWSLQEEKKTSRIIMHLDMDCFFVSVGLRKHPELKGLPVAVTHSKGKKGGPQAGSNIQYEASYYSGKHEKLKGLVDSDEDENLTLPKPKLSVNSKDYGSLSEIASCSYEARKAGLRNGMFMGEALRRCPNLKTIPYDFEAYSEVSKQLYDIVSSYTLDIEAVSVDELYIDCTELLNHTGVSPNNFASILREEIFDKTNCTASAGLGSNMLLARLATKVGKPNGQYHILDSEVNNFMKKQNVEDLPGVGYRTSKKFEQLGILTCGDLQSLSLAKLQQEFGPKTGESIYNKCRGKDNRVVQVQKDRKSVSAEINYGIRFETDEDVKRFIHELATEVQNRLKNINCKGKAITLKLMVRRPDAPLETAKFMGHGVCDHMSKSVILKCATDNSKSISNECCILARALKINPQDYRGVGIQMSKLEPACKEETTHNTLMNFFNQKNSSTKPLVASKSLKVTIPKKTTPEKSTIKHYLSKPVKTSSYNLADFVPDQLDQSVLNALPEDIRKEVLENCAKSTKSPVKPQSEEDYSTSKYIHVQNEQKTLTNVSKCESKPSTSRQFTLNTERNEKSKKPSSIDMSKKCNNPNYSKKRVIEFFITWGNVKGRTCCEPVKQVSLGGAIELDDVRKLLKEWILNTETPMEEDIEELKHFLLDSIDKDLSKVTLLLKYFYRLACSHGLMWKEAYLSILSYVQQKMLQNFGAMLSVKSDFPP